MEEETSKLLSLDEQPKHNGWVPRQWGTQSQKQKQKQKHQGGCHLLILTSSLHINTYTCVYTHVATHIHIHTQREKGRQKGWGNQNATCSNVGSQLLYLHLLMTRTAPNVEETLWKLWERWFLRSKSNSQGFYDLQLSPWCSHIIMEWHCFLQVYFLCSLWFLSLRVFWFKICWVDGLGVNTYCSSREPVFRS